MMPPAVHDRISVHSLCFAGADADAVFDHWRTLGAGRVSLTSGQIAGMGVAETAARLAAGGHRLETVTHVFHEGPLDPAATAADRARLGEAIAAAERLGARSLYMLTGGRGALDWQDAAALFADAVAPCAGQARDAGVMLAIENVSPLFAHGHIATSLRDTITLAEQAGIAICIDYVSCWTEADVRELIFRAAPRLVLVQVSDYVPGDRSLPCRAVPGDGAIPWADVVGWLAAAGYAGAFDLELIGPRIDAEGHVAATTRAIDAFGRLLAAADA